MSGILAKIIHPITKAVTHLVSGSAVPGWYIVHHDVSFSDVVVSLGGVIDCKQEQINSLSFKNQGSTTLVIDGSVRLSPGDSKEYSVEDGSNITNTFSYDFDSTAGTQNQCIITRGKRMESYVTVAILRDK